MKTKLIVFEGIDNSGKTTISNLVKNILLEDSAVLEVLTTHRASKKPEERVASYLSGPLSRSLWDWSKEPTFSTEEADRLNDPSNKIDENEREVLFLESRLRQQERYNAFNTVLDRYLWTGMAYAKMFSPSCYNFTTKLYGGSSIFKEPDLTIFVDTPVEICHSRETEVSVERLEGIRNAYMDTKQFVKGPVFTFVNDGTLEEAVDKVVKIIKETFYGECSERANMNFPFEFPLKISEVLSEEGLLKVREYYNAKN